MKNSNDLTLTKGRKISKAYSNISNRRVAQSLLHLTLDFLLFPFSSGSRAHEVHHPVNCMLYLGDCIIYFYSWKVLLQIHALSFIFPSVLQRFPSVCLIVILPFLSDKMTVAPHWSRVWWDACPGPYDVRGFPLFPKSTSTSNLYWNLFSSSKPCKWDIPLTFLSHNLVLVPFWWSTFQTPLCSHSKSCFLKSISNHGSSPQIPWIARFLLRPAGMG